MLEHLFSPYTLRGKVVKNRCVVSAMVANYCTDDGMATERWLAYHEAKARGGWGMIITEDYAVDPMGRAFSNVAGLWKDEQITGHSELPRRLHVYDAVAIAQIFHAGRNTNHYVIGGTPVAPSAIQGMQSPDVPRELTTEEVETIIGQFADTAYRAKQCGFDGVEIHAAHGYLLCEFMSAYTNKRTDKYGGSTMNRIRMPIEIIRKIRERCGEDFIIGMKISGDEMVDGGRTLQETLAIVPYLEQAGLDMIDVSVSNDDSGQYVVAPSYVSRGWLADAAAAVKSVCSIPVISVGRINDPVLADSIIASGKADFTAMGRASLCDPDLPNKAREGRLEDIRRCIGCDYGCIGILGANKPITCVLNPTLGKEREYALKPTLHPKKVAVIGAGPGGLEAAIVAKRQGHDVTVYEKSDNAGGLFRLASVPPAKGEIADFVRWQLVQCGKLGIEIRYNTQADTALMQREAPDKIILAAGSNPLTPPIKGLDLPHVVYANDVLSGKVAVGACVVVIGGGSVGAEVANMLANPIRRVALVEMRAEIAVDDAMIARIMLLQELAKKGVSCYTNASVTEVTEKTVKIQGAQSFELPADTVVLAAGSRSNNALKAELEAAGFAVEVIGDAARIGNVMGATAGAYAAALNL